MPCSGGPIFKCVECMRILRNVGKRWRRGRVSLPNGSERRRWQRGERRRRRTHRWLDLRRRRSRATRLLAVASPRDQPLMMAGESSPCACVPYQVDVINVAWSMQQAVYVTIWRAPLKVNSGPQIGPHMSPQFAGCHRKATEVHVI